MVVSSDLFPIQCCTVRTSNPLAEHPGRIGGTKSLEIELRWIEASAFRDGLATIEHVLLPISGGRGKHKLAVLSARMFLKFGDEFHGSRNFTILPTLGVEAELWLGRYTHSPQLEVDVTPEEIHDLLFAETGQQEVENNARSKS
jgi:hypothetical protein